MSLERFPDFPLDKFVKDQTKQIRALPVWYKGFQFRSRTEGRWAVFFDAMGIPFQYEPQGFRLVDGTCYLPDFLLPGAATFAEVKPTDPTAEERRKCELTIEGLGGTFVFLAGPPDFRSYAAVSMDAGLLTDSFLSLDIYQHPKAYFSEGRFWTAPDDDELAEEHCSGEYREAVYASRACRFDGKEMPQPGHEPFNLSEREMGVIW